MSFELTINGQTRKFATAAEMAEWRERMQSGTFRPGKNKRRKKSHPQKNRPK